MINNIAVNIVDSAFLLEKSLFSEHFFLPSFKLKSPDSKVFQIREDGVGGVG